MTTARMTFSPRDRCRSNMAFHMAASSSRNPRDGCRRGRPRLIRWRIATWKDLCIDAVDARVLGAFWAETLGLELVPHDDGDAQLDGPTSQHRVWVNTVPEPVTVKQRVHIDVHAASTDEVLARGATPLDSGPLRWDVLARPRGRRAVRVRARARCRRTSSTRSSSTPATRARSPRGGRTCSARRSRTHRGRRGLSAWFEELPGCRSRWSSAACPSRRR